MAFFVASILIPKPGGGILEAARRWAGGRNRHAELGGETGMAGPRLRMHRQIDGAIQRGLAADNGGRAETNGAGRNTRPAPMACTFSANTTRAWQGQNLSRIARRAGETLGSTFAWLTPNAARHSRMNIIRYGIDSDPKTVDVRMKALAAEGLTPESFGLKEFQLRYHLDPSRDGELRELIKQDPIGRQRLSNQRTTQLLSETGMAGPSLRMHRQIDGAIQRGLAADKGAVPKPTGPDETRDRPHGHLDFMGAPINTIYRKLYVSRPRLLPLSAKSFPKCWRP